MAVYRFRKDSLYLYKIPFYGSSRLGVIKENKLIKIKTAQNSIGVMSLPIPVNIAQSKNTTKPSVYTIGKKHYETTDWLGNVRVTYTDKKSWQQNKFTLNVSSSQDYYPFGATMEGRKYNLSAYRYAFNTQERVPELNESHYTALYWEYDGRLARRWNRDPKPAVGVSDYAVFRLNPILYNDVNGDWVPTKISRKALKSGAKEKIINMFKKEYGLEVEIKKRFLGGYKLQLKEGFKLPENASEVLKEWEKALSREKVATDVEGKHVKLSILYKKYPEFPFYDPNYRTAVINLRYFNQENILSIPVEITAEEKAQGVIKISDLPEEVQKQQFSLRAVIEHEYIGHGIYKLDDYNKEPEELQNDRSNTASGLVNKYVMQLWNNDASKRLHYQAPGFSWGVTTIYHPKLGLKNVKYK